MPFLKLNNKYERWLLANLASFNSGLRLLGLSFGLTVLFLILNYFFGNFDWLKYFSQPLCR